MHMVEDALHIEQSFAYFEVIFEGGIHLGEATCDIATLYFMHCQLVMLIMRYFYFNIIHWRKSGSKTTFGYFLGKVVEEVEESYILLFSLGERNGSR
jgi:hypothetical protein